MTDDSIKKRILGLMAKTTNNGCSEEEAMSASAKVQELLHIKVAIGHLTLKQRQLVEPLAIGSTSILV